MSNAIQQAAKKLRGDDHVVVVLWDKVNCQGTRTKMKYADAKRQAAENRDWNPIETRIIVLPAY